ncbi:hypothetical protein DFH06DRAFT_1398461 [Mycena polygramma]|nr:hypothetical protein DFH06DRAFT_1398461 [Mycena polygramma]
MAVSFHVSSVSASFFPGSANQTADDEEVYTNALTPGFLKADLAMSASSRADRARLCRSSKLLHDIGVPILYREVDLDSHASATSFSSAVVLNPGLCGWVRSFTFVKGPLWNSTRAFHSSASLLESLKSMVRLEHLSFAVGVLFGKRLFLCDGLFPCPSSTATFTLHPADGRPCRIPLPNLQRYWGPAEFIPSLEASNIGEVWICWDHSADSVERFNIVVALKALTRRDVMCSNEGFPDDFTEIVHSLSRHLPQMKLFHLDLSDTAQLIVDVKASLPHLKGLLCLSIEDAYNSYYIFEEESDLANLAAFGDLCPTLRCCRLNTHALTKANGVWHAFPVDAPFELAGVTLRGM